MNSAHLPITAPALYQKIQSNQGLKNNQNNKENKDNKDNKDKSGEELVSASSGTK